MRSLKGMLSSTSDEESTTVVYVEKTFDTEDGLAVVDGQLFVCTNSPISYI